MPQLTLKNTGPIHKAHLHLKGITLLTGPTNTGKTTLAKALYSTLKVQEKAYPAALQAFEKAMRQLVLLEQEYGLHEEEIILADLAPNIYLTVYQRTVERVVEVVEQLEATTPRKIRRADAQRLVRSCNILFHLNGVDHIAQVVQHFKKEQLVVPKALLTAKEQHNQLMGELFEEGYVNRAAPQESTLLDLYTGKTASIYQRVKGPITTHLTFGEQIYSAAIVLDVAEIMAVLTKEKAIETVPIYTQELVQHLLDTNLGTAEQAPLSGVLKTLLQEKLSLEQQQAMKQNLGEAPRDYSALPPDLQTFSLLQTLINKKTITSSSLLILEEPKGIQDWTVYSAILVGLMEAGLSLLVITTHQALMEAFVPYHKKKPTNKWLHVYQTKVTAQGSVLEDHTTSFPDFLQLL